jgi:hypothetical protein
LGKTEQYRSRQRKLAGLEPRFTQPSASADSYARAILLYSKLITLPFYPKTTMLTLATKFRPDRLQAFDTAYQAGVRGAEFWLDDALLSNWKTIASTARGYSFRYALHFPNEGVLQADALRCAVCLYNELKCRTMVIHQPMHDQYADDLLGLDPSLHLAVENHRLDTAEFDRWAEQNRWLTLDVEHLWMCTLQDASLEHLLDYLGQFLSRYGKKLRHVHLPGYRVGGDEHCPMYYSADMATRVLGLLADDGFSELVVSEADKQYQNLDELRQDVVMFEGWQTQYFSRCSTSLT